MSETHQISETGADLERAGNWNDALRAHRDLFEEGVRAKDLARIVSGLRGQARVMHRDSRYEEAEELGLLSWEIAARNNLGRDLGRAINMVAIARHAMNDLDGAEQLYLRALEQARIVSDDEHIGLVCQNLGVIANIRGDLREARTLYLECIGSSVRSGNRTTSIAAYNNLGMVCSDMQEWMEAGLYFDRGLEIAQRIGQSASLGRLYLNRAEPLINVGELAQALKSLNEAEAAASRIEDRAVTAAAARFRARISRLEGDLGIADEYIARSIETARAADLQLEYAEALAELAHLRQSAGAAEEALSIAREARDRFQALGAAREVSRLERDTENWIGESSQDAS